MRKESGQGKWCPWACGWFRDFGASMDWPYIRERAIASPSPLIRLHLTHLMSANSVAFKTGFSHRSRRP